MLETFYHTLENGEKAKFTISEKIIGGEIYYFAYVINTEIEPYTSLEANDKGFAIGTEVTNGNHQTVLYKSHKKLKKDIIDFYGKRWLVSEI